MHCIANKESESAVDLGHARALESLLQQVDSDLAIADQFGDERFILNALQDKGKQITLVQGPRAAM